MFVNVTDLKAGQVAIVAVGGSPVLVVDVNRQVVDYELNVEVTVLNEDFETEVLTSGKAQLLGVSERIVNVDNGQNIHLGTAGKSVCGTRYSLNSCETGEEVTCKKCLELLNK